MAMQLTPLLGTTAFPDRMGDYYPELLEAGRIVQGHDVSGAMSAPVIDAVNRDLEDTRWRSIFHAALNRDRRFQRGLFDDSQLSPKENTDSKNFPVLSKLTQNFWVDRAYQVDTVKALSRTAHTAEEGLRFEYGWALVKTAAALIYTIRLCHQLELVAVTESPSHYQLLTRTCNRDNLELAISYVPREGN